MLCRVHYAYSSFSAAGLPSVPFCSLPQWVCASPNSALRSWAHEIVGFALKRLRKFLEILQDAGDPELAGAVGVGLDGDAGRLWSVRATPHLGKVEEEELLVV